ncbi:hypothetical protein ASE16_02410 [Leifsonia sp. Root227]|nr:hypothetical protein ASE16_02410 [Leifsonia sp. Root227]
MAANINPQGTASVVGRAVPLSFAIATVCAFLIAYSFVRLTQRYSHAGSVYGFVGATLGPRAGIVSGWLLAIVYAFYAIFTAVAAGKFLVGEVRTLGVWTHAPDWLGYVFAAIALGVVWFFATRTARRATQLMLIVEALTVILILIVVAIIFAKLLVGDTPNGQTFDLSVFIPAPNSDISGVFLGVVFGLLSFGGFEGAATLGEETKSPRRDVPRAIWGTVLFGGIFYVIVTAAEVMGFGTSPKEIDAFVASPSLLGDLSDQYVSVWLGHVITFGAAISALSGALACTVGSSRLVFALSRDGAGPRSVAKVSGKHGVPHRAVAAVIIFSLIYLAIGLVTNISPFDEAVIAGTAGTLMLIVCYFLACAGSTRLFFTPGSTIRKWELIVPALAMITLIYTMFRNIYPFPEGTAWWGPGIFIGAVVLTILGVLIRPEAVRAAGRRLTESEGLILPGDESGSRISDPALAE